MRKSIYLSKASDKEGKTPLFRNIPRGLLARLNSLLRINNNSLKNNYQCQMFEKGKNKIRAIFFSLQILENIWLLI